jgi:hypothetical protein
VAFSKTREREQTELPNRPQPISGNMGATIIGLRIPHVKPRTRTPWFRREWTMARWQT